MPWVPGLLQDLCFCETGQSRDQGHSLIRNEQVMAGQSHRRTSGGKAEPVLLIES